MARLQPRSYIGKQVFRFGDACSKRCRVNEFAGVVRKIALVPQSIEHRDALSCEPDGFRQRLDDRLMVPERLCVGTESTGHHARQRRLHDALVCGVESILGAYVLRVRVGQVASGGGQQVADFADACDVRLDAADFHQIIQCHQALRS